MKWRERIVGKSELNAVTMLLTANVYWMLSLSQATSFPLLILT